MKRENVVEVFSNHESLNFYEIFTLLQKRNFKIGYKNLRKHLKILCDTNIIEKIAKNTFRIKKTIIRSKLEAYQEIVKHLPAKSKFQIINYFRNLNMRKNEVVSK